MNFSVEIPRPSRYVRHIVIDEIANGIARMWVNESTSVTGDVIDVEDFVASALSKEIDWEMISEPPSRTCFAALVGDRILLNRRHESLFREKPFLLRSCLAHEAGHEILLHAEKLPINENQPSLFGDTQSGQLRFHDSSLRRFDVSNDEYLEIRRQLARQAAVNAEARELLASLDDRLEPDWMFFQAEQFASCFLIPKDRLFAALETGVNLGQWKSIYDLAEQFGTSVSMMCVRLQKLNLIALNGKEIRLIPTTLGPRLF